MDVEFEKHKLVPKHVVLNGDEAREILSKYNISLTQLPKISRKDPAIKELDLKRGDIIKIIRKSGTAGEAVYFRTIYD